MRAPALTFKRAHVLRRRMTLPEVILWQELRRSRFKNLRFRRQHPIGPYILDFFCSSARLAVGTDGSSHENESRYRHDERRTGWLKRKNITVLRVAAADVLRDDSLEDVLNCIEQASAPSTAFGGPPPPLRGGGTQGR